MRGQIRVKKGNPIRLWLRHLDMAVACTESFEADSAYIPGPRQVARSNNGEINSLYQHSIDGIWRNKNRKFI
jgi:hypothetical protein